jgi:threonine aldolase
VLSDQDYVEYVLPVDTNIVIFRLAHQGLATDFVQKLNALGLGAVTFGKYDVRFVTHLDFDDQQLEDACELLKKL